MIMMMLVRCVFPLKPKIHSLILNDSVQFMSENYFISIFRSGQKIFIRDFYFAPQAVEYFTIWQ